MSRLRLDFWRKIDAIVNFMSKGEDSKETKKLEETELQQQQSSREGKQSLRN